MLDFPQSEQCFWMVEDVTRKYTSGETITQAIKKFDIKFLACDMSNHQEMIPSFGLQQVFLEVAFPHAVRINPVIGDSTPLDIRKGSFERYRDIALPFPGNALPKMADGFQALSALDFMFHDRYHALRASRVVPEETKHYVAIGDILNVIQQRYNLIVKEVSRRHEMHERCLPEFGQAVAKLSADKQRKVVAEVLQKWNREIAIINKLKRMRKSTGQFKFRLWDMERPLSGGTIDEANPTPTQVLRLMIGNIEMEVGLLGKFPNTIELSRYSARKIAEATLEIIKPDAATLTEVQKEMNLTRRHIFSYLFQSTAHRTYNDVITETKPGLLTIS